MSKRYMRGAAFASKGNVRVETKGNSRQNWRIECGAFSGTTATNATLLTVNVAFQRKFGQLGAVVVTGEPDAGTGQRVVVGTLSPSASGFAAIVETTTGGVFGAAAAYSGKYIAIGSD